MRIIEIAAMLLLAAPVPAAAGPAPVAPPPVSSNVVSAADYRPTDDAVISAVVAFWKGYDDRRLAALNKDLQDQITVLERLKKINTAPPRRGQPT